MYVKVAGFVFAEVLLLRRLGRALRVKYNTSYTRSFTAVINTGFRS